jgi:hypothetical protein
MSYEHFTKDQALEEAALNIKDDSMVDFALEGLLRDMELQRNLVDRVILGGQRAALGAVIIRRIEDQLVKYIRKGLHER